MLIGFLDIAKRGGELTDFIIVLRTNDVVMNFCSDAYFSIGAGVSAAVVSPPVDVHLLGAQLTTRECGRENYGCYGSQSISASYILLVG
ncbi:hypothetical protein CASFOL_014365 [Castilleja foliolosa]|uniref:Uncharacterized protein n=1 Tax=Castilleja foliolosa TaxID=1961234 RepID=A0ABD3DMR1_9LAMI